MFNPNKRGVFQVIKSTEPSFWVAIGGIILAIAITYALLWAIGGL